MTTYRSLQSLLRAFNITLAAGQSFRNNVPGAGDFVQLSSYELESMNNFQSSDLAGDHASGASIHFTFDMNAGGKWYEQLRLPSPMNMAAYFAIDADPGTAAAAIIAGAWNGQQGNTMTVQLTGRAKYGVYSGGSGTLTVVKNWYTDYSPPNVGEGTGPLDWDILLSMNSGTYSPPALTQETFTLVIEYPPTILHSSGYSFNELMQYSTPVRVAPYDAGPPPTWNPMIEWYSDSGYTNLVGTGNMMRFTADSSNYFGDFYVRSRLSTTDPWTNFNGGGPIHWNDVRFGHA